MATDQDTPKSSPKILSVTVSELQSLGDRLLSRGLSKFFADQPAVQSDVLMAAWALRALLRSFNSRDVISLDTNGNGA